MATSVLTRPNAAANTSYQVVPFTDVQLIQLPNILSSPLVKVVLDGELVNAVFNEHYFNEITFNGSEVITESFVKFTHVYDQANQQLLIGFDEKQSGTLIYTY